MKCAWSSSERQISRGPSAALTHLWSWWLVAACPRALREEELQVVCHVTEPTIRKVGNLKSRDSH